jgi:hypothetical protein
MMTTADLVQTRTHSPALAAPEDADAAAEIVSAQWRRASAGLVEIVRFGALMVQIERGLAQRQTRAGLYQGQTLKGWLSEHCPEINYKTAHGYRDAAVGLAAAAALPDAMPLLQLMDGEAAFAPELQAAHDSVMAVLASSSIAFLKAQSRRGGARPGAGRPPKTLADPDVQLEEALRCALRLTDMVRSWAIDEDGLGTLPDGPLETFLANMGDVCKRGREILSGRAAASKRRV